MFFDTSTTTIVLICVGAALIAALVLIAAFRKNSAFTVKKLVTCAMLTALGVILGGALSIPVFNLGVYSLKIGIGILPVLISAVMYGPLWGGAVGGLTDLIQALLFPKGPYVPWFTLVGILFGVIPGLFFMRRQKPTIPRLAVSIAAGQLICSVGINTMLITTLYGSAFGAIFWPRLIVQAFMIPSYTIIIYFLLKALRINNTPQVID